ncbi:ImmA/IrrE family metallo-endopeptidase [Tardiphaga sp. 20_F10_N6_6]|jgi:hypothetical protein|uniref:ImmA/IrrE family metallo-endopeptidase n=1 Tax=unclassified Tardiphaga TaxID=2631404 RepID=UPI003F243936
MPYDKRSVDEHLTPAQIAQRARLIRKFLDIHDRPTINVLHLFEALSKIFPRLKLRIVPDSHLLEAEARAYPNEWLIKLRHGVREGLLRGEARSRWTFMHELGHVLMQHPGKPFRKKLEEKNATIEQQAHIFAAEFLAPTDLVQDCNSVEQVRKRFGLSSPAARRRFSEVKLDNKTIGAQEQQAHALSSADYIDLEDQAASICAATAATIAETALPVEPFKNNLFSTSTATAAAAGLLKDAHQSARSSNVDTRTHSAAALVAAILAIKPIREIGIYRTLSPTILSLNQLCALKAVSKYLGVDLTGLEKNLATPTEATLSMSFESDYLVAFIKQINLSISSSSTILHLDEYAGYYEYNEDNDINWTEILRIEFLEKLIRILPDTTSVAR